MQVEVDLLGDFAVRVEGRTVPSDEWRRRGAGSLGKRLALAPRGRLHRAQVIDALWPGLPAGEAAPRLHKAAHYARRSLGDPRAVVLGGDRVSLFPDRDVEVDARTFERAAEAVLGSLGAPSNDQRTAAADAADLWTGELLPEDLYESWACDERERLHRLYAELLRRAGRWTELARADPVDMEANLAVARQLADTGDRRAALRQLERLEKAIHHELGVISD